MRRRRGTWPKEVGEEGVQAGVSNVECMHASELRLAALTNQDPNHTQPEARNYDAR